MPECRAAAVLTCLFWLSLVQARQHDTLTRLKQDVEKLNELGYVQVIEGPTPVPVVAANVSGIVALYPTEDDGINGPWQIDINIRGASPWLGPFRARLTCNEFYPKHLCSVAFRSSVAHPRLSQGHGSAPDRKFYSSISDKTVVGVVVALHALLTQNLQLKHNSDAYYTAQFVPRTTSTHLTRQAKQRAATISKYSTMRKTPALFNDTVPWPREWFAPGVLDAIAEGGDALRAILRQEVPGVYSFPLFRKEFAEIFLAELDNFYKSGLPIRRPNSMNNYGLIVNEIGMEAAIFQLQAEVCCFQEQSRESHEVLQPVARLLFPEEGSSLDTHHSFIVEYRPDKDLGLDMHTDDSDVTFNVCLGRNFTGAGLKFCGKMGHPDHRLFQTSYQHEVGRCVVHLGAQRHGADDIRTGQRNNLIIWNHNLAFRNIGGHRKHGCVRSQCLSVGTACQRLLRAGVECVLSCASFHVEERAPDLDCLSYTHDRDYAVFKEFPKGREEMGKRPGWCPPNEKCYDSMLPAWQLTALRQYAHCLQLLHHHSPCY